MRVVFASALLVSASMADQMSWDDAYARANEMLEGMTKAQKYTLMQGAGWSAKGPGAYVGYTIGMKDLGIPAITMADASNGFRTMPGYIGTSTGWPSLLSLGATFDPLLVRRFAEAMAEEFAQKGGSMVLGPSINVHRVARNGRNFEYMSGEDPYLGAKLAKPFVEGVQSRKLMTSMKHWVFNHQETNRGEVSMVVDDKTAWELYYPPFQAAVDAGSTTVMCSYNRVDGTHSCSNEKQLQVLKQKMGFRGFIQSDWLACHNTTVVEGLDQEMPGAVILDSGPVEPFNNFSPEKLDSIPESNIDDSARRILAAMYKVGSFETPSCELYGNDEIGTCSSYLLRNATGDDHNAKAREYATESIVLLKNDGNVLPIISNRVRTIAIVGSAADQESYCNTCVGADTFQGDYYSGGGSGHVQGPYVVKPLDGITGRAAQAGIQVISSTNDDVEAAVNVASQADLTLVIGGATSSEQFDRVNLTLDHRADDLIWAVANANKELGKKTIVLTQVPGAIVMPWRDSVDAILTLFLGGQETGNAWASVLFGDHAPTGRLPITMPASEDDVIHPSQELEVKYDEGMATGYRNPALNVAYPFGHGLTYTTFTYDNIETFKCGIHFCVKVDVVNTGEISGKAVPQLYVEFPAEAGHPAPLLKGFEKTGLIAPSQSRSVTFTLTDQDLSYYSDGMWVRIANQELGFKVLIGESSRDIFFTRRIEPDSVMV